MGLPLPLVELLLSERRYRKFDGEALLIGRQTTYLTERTFNHLVTRDNIILPANFTIELDTDTDAGKKLHCISDRCLMEALGFESTKFLDVTDYEGADIVHDLGTPVDQSLYEQFDFIYNGSCLDNMFNPGTALINMSKMLKRGGRILHIEHATPFNGPYLIYSPGWFFDYYVTNGFADVKVHLALFTTANDLAFGPWYLHYYNWPAENSGVLPKGPGPDVHMILIVLAEKKDDSTCERQPVQNQYRQTAELRQAFNSKIDTVLTSPRPIFSIGQLSKGCKDPWVALGTIGDGLPI